MRVGVIIADMDFISFVENLLIFEGLFMDDNNFIYFVTSYRFKEKGFWYKSISNRCMYLKNDYLIEIIHQYYLHMTKNVYWEPLQFRN